ncbi:MAG: hypothetical protein ACRD2A_19105 [Vicinamibacterales bacterium]
MNRGQRWRLITVASACAGALALAAVAVLLVDAASGGVSGPRVGDHWHAPYEVIVCGQPQPPIEEFSHTSGIHTHGDGIMHLHPITAAGEGSGATVAMFFKNSGGWFDSSFAPEGCSIEDGDPLVPRADSGIHPLGSGFSAASEVCNAIAESAFQGVSRDYVPKDGDCVRVLFGRGQQ